ncbi:MAG TPA: hypothetical protein EYQ27_20215, partial [Gemmatimonadetes bacterium]|nr:hypothetical protein [Gemmatimonadota bacterium]
MRRSIVLAFYALCGLIALLSSVPPARAQQPATPEYDYVIRNGRVLDGAGNPWINADVAVRAG